MTCNVEIADDYAVVSFDGGCFYYGYEITQCQTCYDIDCPDEDHGESDWCFVVTEKNGTEIITPGSDLGGKGVVEKLLYGIANYMNATQGDK